MNLQPLILLVGVIHRPHLSRPGLPIPRPIQVVQLHELVDGPLLLLGQAFGEAFAGVEMQEGEEDGGLAVFRHDTI